jgi:hypothetical protein
MKLIEKFMLKRCSTEVQVMLTRMRERPEDFDYGTGWRNLVEVADNGGSPYTKIERRMIRKYWKECEYTRKRNELLGRIMKETIAVKLCSPAIVAQMPKPSRFSRSPLARGGGP